MRHLQNHPLRAQLAASDGHAWLRLPAGAQVPRRLADACERRGVTLHLRPDDDGATRLHLSWPHDRLDVFAFSFLLSRFGAELTPAPARGDGSGTVAHAAGACRSAHRCLPIGACDDGTTLTQRLLRSVLPTLRAGGVTHVSIVVALASPAALDEHNCHGNGFMPVDFSVDALAERARAPKAAWQGELRDRAARLLRLAARSTTRVVRSQAQVMLSAGGDFDRFAWAAPFVDPTLLQTIATPWRPETFNLYTWARHGRQALGLCADPAHPLWRAEARLFADWESSLR